MARSKKDIDRELMYKKILPTATIAEEKVTAAQKTDDAQEMRAQIPPFMAVSIAEPVKVIVEPESSTPETLQREMPTPMQPQTMPKEADIANATERVAQYPEAPAQAVQVLPSTPEPMLVNLMEGFLEKRLDAALAKFKCCNCEKCRKDVSAIALNKLPPLYVIEDDPDMRDLHERERSAQVATALVQAILVVKSRPAHG